MVEQRPFKPKVVGSIPTAPTSFLFHSKGLANSARQQKAAIANLAGSASSVTGCGMDGNPTHKEASTQTFCTALLASVSVVESLPGI